MKFTLGLAQVRHPEDGDVVSLVEEYAAQAVKAGAEMFVFPESLMARFDEEKGGFTREAESLDGPFCRAIDAIAAKHGLWIVYTVNEMNPHGKPYNTAVITDRDGLQRGSYRKVHLFDSAAVTESSRMSASDTGTTFEPADTPFGRIGLGICYDLRFPEVAREAALSGAQLMLYPAAWVDGPCKAQQWQTMLAARAIENGMFVAGVSRCDSDCTGASCIVNPQGEIIASAEKEPQLLIAEIDTREVAAARQAIPVLDWYRQQQL